MERKNGEISFLPQDSAGRNEERRIGRVASDEDCYYVFYRGHMDEWETIRKKNLSPEQKEAFEKELRSCMDPEKELKERITQRLFEQSGLCKRFQQRSFENFRTDTPARAAAYAQAKNYADHFSEALETGEGLYIEGTYGTGKTHLAAAIAMQLMGAEYAVIMKTGFEILGGIKRTFGLSSGEAEYQAVEKLKKCDLLIIDDLGKEQCTDWGMSVLYAIVNYRYETMKPIVVTTNYNTRMLRAALTPKGYDGQKVGAIVSRLTEMCTALTMLWGDYREGGSGK